MSRRTSGGVGRAWLSASLLLSASVFAQQIDPSAVPDRAELERRGATIRAINVTVDNVFDPSKPDEDKRLYRWANRVHILTRESVVEAVLLFEVGDQFRGRLLDESARTLRARGFLSEATAEPRAYDPATNTVEVDVRVRDSWSLAPELDLDHSGGVTEYEIGMEDGNLFGTGKELSISYSSDVDRSQVFLGYGDSNVFNSRVRLSAALANASDGHRRALSAERPFYSLDTRWQLGGGVLDEERVDTMYDLGEEIDQFRHDIRSLTLQGGWSSGLQENRALRWIGGLTTEEDTFEPTPELPQPLLLPENRKLVFPWVGLQLIEDDYREMSELNDMGRTEDVALGLNLYFSVGFAKKHFGSDRDATLYRASAQMGWEPGEAGQLLLFNAGGWTRDEDEAGLRNSVAFVGARYYRRNFEKHMFIVSMEALTSNNLDAENQVLLGGDNGLRGYPLRYQAGERRALITAEQRFYTEVYPWRLFRMGYAAFVDAGRVEGQDPRGAPPLGTLYDVGVGLRLTSPRSSGRNVVHIDLAFPLNGDPSIDSVQLVLQTKGSF